MFLTPDGTPSMGAPTTLRRRSLTCFSGLPVCGTQSREQVLTGAQQIKEALEQVVTLPARNCAASARPEIFRAYKAADQSV